MNSHYYSRLDLINKYQFLNLYESNDIVDTLEISLKKLEKEEIEGKNTDLESINFFYSFFTRSPKITVKNLYDSGKFSREIQKKVQIFNKKNIFDILNFIVTQCHVSNENLTLVKREKGTFSLVYEIKLAYKKHSLQLPSSLLRRSGNEIPTIKVEVFFNKSCVHNISDVYPFWQLSHLKSLEKNSH